jgi:hypothetical protein
MARGGEEVGGGGEDLKSKKMKSKRISTLERKNMLISKFRTLCGNSSVK